jgi:hypothetical protein
MDLVAALSGFFAAASVVWILLGLFIALVLGTLMASFFVSLFYDLSRLARVVETGYETKVRQALPPVPVAPAKRSALTPTAPPAK